MMRTQNSHITLNKFQPKHKFFIGIDSDGCVFDTMEIKQKECFIPNIIKYWKLQSISKYVRETAEFVNLYSKWRGTNRFLALVLVFELLQKRKEVKKRKITIPDLKPLKQWIETETKLSNFTLKIAVEKNKDPILDLALKWSEAVNHTIRELVENIPPFLYVKESLKRLSKFADIIVISATPQEALNKEWKEHNIAKFVKIMAGQELGTKEKHLELFAKGKYPANHILIIGDAFGDLKTAKDNAFLFYPINPGQEEKSWRRFYNEAIEVFLQGKYKGRYEEKLIREFEKFLSKTPPWK